MKIIDDFLVPRYHEHIQHVVQTPDFPWHYHNNITYKQHDNLNGFGFATSITSDGKNWHNPFFIPLVYQIQNEIAGDTTIGRVRLDMTLYNPEDGLQSPHVDSQQPHWASIYYVNDSDGDTLIYNETEYTDNFTIQERIEPKANRLLIFDGKFFHTGSSPSKHKNRIIINSNFYK